MATIQDVARTAQVSVSTVSNVLNGRINRMKKDTLDRVLQAMAALNYRPSSAARQLKTGLAPVLGLLVPSIANPMFALLAREIEAVAKKDYGHRILLGNTYRIKEEEELFLNDLYSHGVRGMVVVSSLAEQSHFQDAIAHGMTIVNYDRRSMDDSAQNMNADNISMNNHQAGKIAAQCLIDAGCRRIAFVTVSRNTISRRDKIDGFFAAAEEAGLADSASVIALPSETEYGDSEMTELGMQIAAEIAAMDTRPDGIVAINDMMAIGLLAGLRKHLICVPADICLVGIDDVYLSALVHPALTSVRPPVKEMAQLLVHRLMARMADKTIPAEDFLFTPELIERKSVLVREH